MRPGEPGRKMPLVASVLMLACDCIDDADVLRPGGTAGAGVCGQGAIHPGRHVPAQHGSGIGSAASCWPGPGRLGRTRRRAIRPVRPGTSRRARAYHGWARGAISVGRGRMAPARGTGCANIRSTSCRERYHGRADSGFYNAIVAKPPDGCRFSITIRQSAMRSLIEAIPESDGAHPLLDGRAPPTLAETSSLSLPEQARRPPVRLIVRRVQPTPGSQLALFATYSYHGFITEGGKPWYW